MQAGSSFICDCKASQRCHVDVLIHLSQEEMGVARVVYVGRGSMQVKKRSSAATKFPPGRDHTYLDAALAYAT